MPRQTIVRRLGDRLSVGARGASRVRNPGPVERRSTWSQIRFLLGDRRGSLAALAVSSVLSGLAESAILALLIQVATGLVNGTSRVRLDIGPVHGTTTVAALLVAAFILAAGRLALQAVLSVVPARVAADIQTRLRVELFAAF